jgi:Mn-dependent DtxR family transcriptional regulator
MSIDILILRAMLRLARRRKAADEGEVAVRVGGAPGSVRAALRRLDARGLVERRHGQAPRLTMAGFAVAVALLPERPAQASRASKLRSVRTSRAA